MDSNEEQNERRLWLHERGRNGVEENSLVQMFHAYTFILIYYLKSLILEYIHLLLHKPWELVSNGGYVGFPLWHMVSYCHANINFDFEMDVDYSSSLLLGLSSLHIVYHWILPWTSQEAIITFMVFSMSEVWLRTRGPIRSCGL